MGFEFNICENEKKSVGRGARGEAKVTDSNRSTDSFKNDKNNCIFNISNRNILTFLGCTSDI